MDMRITGSCREGVLTLHFQGELDHHAAGEAMAAISERIDAFLPGSCVLDLSGISFRDSSGIALMLRTDKLMRRLGGKLTVTGPTPQTIRVLTAAGLDRRLTIKE